jgi:hypothetical protein
MAKSNLILIATLGKLIIINQIKLKVDLNKYFLNHKACLIINVTRAQQLYTINLQSNTSGPLLTKTDQYYKLDSYLNLCLSKLETCDNGVTLIFDLKLLYPNIANQTEYISSYGRTVLASSGGDSPYSTAGFYLHQFSVRGDNYLEFGLSSYNDIYKTKVFRLHFTDYFQLIVKYF